MTYFASRRRTILVFYNPGGGKPVERYSIGRFDYDKLYTMYPTSNDGQHEGLRKLGEGPYFLGDQVSLVDLQFAPFFERFGTYEQLGGATWPADCSRLKAWFEAMQSRASYRATARPVEYHLEARRQMQQRIAARNH